jgi:hypothetical protein
MSSKNNSPRPMGVARVHISNLQFLPGSRDVNPRIVEKLKKIYSKVGCQRYDSDNQVLVLLSSSEMDTLLEFSSLTPASLRAPFNNGTPYLLRLPQDGTIICSSGKQRITAAAEFFTNPDDQWWLIKFFTLDASGKPFPKLKFCVWDLQVVQIEKKNPYLRHGEINFTMKLRSTTDTYTRK